MKRKIITKEQLDRLVSLGVVENNYSEYKYDGCCLYHGIMENELLGKTVGVEENDVTDDIGRFPYMTKEESPWHIPAFILACNYKKMLAMAEGEENTKQSVNRISVELDVKGARKTEYVCPPKSDTGADMYFEMDEGDTMDFILPNGDRYTVGFSSDTMTILGVTAHR